MTYTHPETYRCNDPEHIGHDRHCAVCGEAIIEVQHFDTGSGGAYLASGLEFEEKPTEDWVEEFHTKFRWLYDATYRHKDVIRDFDYEKLLEHIRTLIATREKAAREEGERDSIAWGFSKGKKVGREVLKKELLEKIGECRWKNVPINRPYGYLYDEAIADAVDIIKSLK